MDTDKTISDKKNIDIKHPILLRLSKTNIKPRTSLLKFSPIFCSIYPISFTTKQYLSLSSPTFEYIEQETISDFVLK